MFSVVNELQWFELKKKRQKQKKINTRREKNEAKLLKMNYWRKKKLSLPHSVYYNVLIVILK